MANKNKLPVRDKRTKQRLPEITGSVAAAWICAGVIALITCFVFLPSLQNTFTNWDDGDYVMNNPLVIKQAGVNKIFTTTVSGNYHPLTMLTLAWNYAAGKLNPTGYHEENILFHVLNTVLVFFFVFLLTRRNLLMAGFVALFFGIHPMHVESVAWVSERKDVLYVFFFISGLLAYLRYRETQKPLWYALTLVLFLLSCLSKGMAVIFPAVLFLVDYLLSVKWSWKIVIEKIPFLLFSVAFGIEAIRAQNETGYVYLGTYTLPQRVAFASYGAIMYVVKLFAPVNLVVYYPYPDLDSSGGIPFFYYLFPLMLLAVAVLVYVFLKKEKEIVFGLLFYLVGVVLVLQFLTVGKSIMADRYTYLSYIGLLFALAYIVNKAWQAQSGIWQSLKNPIAAVVVIAAIIFSFESYGRTQVWKNTETLWADQIEKYPNNFYAYENRGNYYAGIGANEKAMQDFNKALQLKPTDFEAYCNRAIVYKSEKQFDLALADFNKSLSLDTSQWIVFFNRGICLTQMNKQESALHDFLKCEQLCKTDDRIYNAIGTAQLGLGRYAEAETNFSKAIQLNPENKYNWLNRARAETYLGKTDEAKADAAKGRQLGM